MKSSHLHSPSTRRAWSHYDAHPLFDLLVLPERDQGFWNLTALPSGRVEVVPEPSSGLLMAFGLLLVAVTHRRSMPGLRSKQRVC